uniref:Uncharacterized protein n=1 Tax=Tanacetum cinerariifolium TaxID=118510 RepID=A0A6L2LGK8_TANCI|nr:hypothetical protein [Tanacetum cinerariifolium]
MTGNISYLSDFKEINGRYVAFGRNPKGKKITGKGKIKTGKLDFNDVYFAKELKFNLFSVSQICDKKNNVLFTDTKCVVFSSDFKLPDKNHVLLRVPRENNMYNVDLKNIVSSGDLTCLFAKAALNEASNIEPLVSLNLSVLSANHYKGSGPKWLFDVDTLTQSMNYQSVVAENQPNHNAGIQENLDAGVRDLSDEFEEFSINSTNKINAARAPVTAVGPNPTNSTNSFNAASPSDNVVSSTFKIGGKSSFVNPSQYPDDPDMPALEDIVYSDNKEDIDKEYGKDACFNVVSSTFEIGRKSSFVNPSQYPDDPDMPALEDIIYSDDEEDIGAEADFSNLETNISVSLIPTTRVHKDHHVYQFIGELTIAPQTRSMARMLKEQGGLTQLNAEDFHTCMFACFLSQKEPMRVQQALKDPSWIEAMQKELLQFKMQKVYVGDIIFGSTNNELCKAFEKLTKDKFQMILMGELTFFLGLQVKQKDDEIFISQDKYVARVLRKFSLTDVKSRSTPIETEKPLLKDPDGDDVVVHIYRYLKGKTHLGLWYLKDSPFNLVAYSDSDYAGASFDRKSTTGGCQFLGCRLISWQCKKHTVVSTSSTEAEYVAAASCCAQVLWIQNQLLDYGGKGITRNTDKSPRKLVKASTKVRLLEKAGKEARLLEMNKSKLIKVVHEVAKEAGVDPKSLQSSKGGQEFIKKQDDE